jgi:uncharacterized protein YdhG (YjbR/CyaY superfamily)
VVRVAGKVVAYLASNDRSRPVGVPDNEEFVIVRINFDRREQLLELNPKAFFVTPHYQDYPGVIVRLSTVDQRQLKELLVESWRLVAPKRLTATSEPKTVDQYIAAQPPAVQELLGRVRSTIRKAVPEAQEGISYKMPTYTLYGDRLLHFAVWKQHYSIYAATEQVVAAFQEELAPYKIDKGTIRFPLSEPVPVKLIERIAKFRAKEMAER